MGINGRIRDHITEFHNMDTFSRTHPLCNVRAGCTRLEWVISGKRCCIYEAGSQYLLSWSVSLLSSSRIVCTEWNLYSKQSTAPNRCSTKESDEVSVTWICCCFSFKCQLNYASEIVWIFLGSVWSIIFFFIVKNVELFCIFLCQFFPLDLFPFPYK
jgi:hypothetical protein